MTICHASPSGVGGRFIGATGTIGAIGGGGGNGTTGFGTLGTFLFRIIGSDVLVAFGN